MRCSAKQIGIKIFFCAIVVLLCGSQAAESMDATTFSVKEQPKRKEASLLSICREKESEIDALLGSMSIEQLVGQLIVPILYPSTDESHIKTAQTIVHQIGAGGILFQKGDPFAQYMMTQQLNEVSDIPLLITADAEWGLAMRLHSTIRYPRNGALSNCTSEQITQMGNDLAAQCSIMGIHVNFAPVVDINNNPANPVIGTRSFGTTKDEVIRCALAFSQGMESRGILTVAKHFPGHGNTNKDSHKTLPTISGSASSIRGNEIAAFRAYIAAGYGGIMVGHLSVPSLDSSKKPASLSNPIVTTLLREELGFQGLVFTDGLQMSGVQQGSKHPIGVACLLAGNDLLLGPIDPIQMHKEIVQAVNQGILTRSLLESHVKRVLRAKYALIGSIKTGQEHKHCNSENELLAEINSERFCAHADQLWYESLQIQKNAALFPLSTHIPIGLLELGKGGGATGTFRKSLNELGIKLQAVLVAHEDNSLEDIINQFKGCEIVLVNSYEGKQNAALVTALSSHYRVIYAHFASPYSFNCKRAGTNKSESVVCAYESCDEAKRAYAARLFFSKDSEARQAFYIVRPKGRVGKKETINKFSSLPNPCIAGMKAVSTKKIPKHSIINATLGYCNSKLPLQRPECNYSKSHT